MGRSDILRGLQEIKMRSFLTIVAVLGLLWAEPQPAFAQFYGPGPWCAVVNTGMGNMCIGTASTGQYNNASRTCSPVIAGFAIRTRALSRIIPRPITASVTLARSRPYRSGPSRTWIKVKNPNAPAAIRVIDDNLI
jgi:hypothetical protein